MSLRCCRAGQSQTDELAVRRGIDLPSTRSSDSRAGRPLNLELRVAKVLLPRLVVAASTLPDQPFKATTTIPSSSSAGALAKCLKRPLPDDDADQDTMAAALVELAPSALPAPLQAPKAKRVVRAKPAPKIALGDM